MKRGFTFAELIISMFIILVLILISVPFYSSLRGQLNLTRAAVRMAQDFRKAQELTMSAQEYYDILTGTYIIPSGGYGLCFKGWPSDPTQYYVFADYSGKDNVCNLSLNQGEIIDTVKLEKGITITSVGGNIVNIIFHAPDPEVIFAKPGGQLSSESESVVTLSNGAKTITVHVNRAGLVYIQ